MNELDVFKKKLIYKSRHRGCKENDLLLGEFTKKYIDKLNYTELKMLDAILDEPDLDIFKWITNKQAIPLNHNNKITKLLQHFKLL